MISILLVEYNVRLGVLYQKIINTVFGQEVFLDIVHNSVRVISKVTKKNKYDLIILDMEMHALSSLEVVRQIKQIGFSNPILIHTVLGLPEVKNEIIEGICQGFILKTADGKGLITAIHQFIKA